MATGRSILPPRAPAWRCIFPALHQATGKANCALNNGSGLKKSLQLSQLFSPLSLERSAQHYCPSQHCAGGLPAPNPPVQGRRRPGLAHSSAAGNRRTAGSPFANSSAWLKPPSWHMALTKRGAGKASESGCLRCKGSARPL